MQSLVGFRQRYPPPWPLDRLHGPLEAAPSRAEPSRAESSRAKPRFASIRSSSLSLFLSFSLPLVSSALLLFAAVSSFSSIPCNRLGLLAASRACNTMPSCTTASTKPLRLRRPLRFFLLFRWLRAERRGSVAWRCGPRPRFLLRTEQSFSTDFAFFPQINASPFGETTEFKWPRRIHRLVFRYWPRATVGPSVGGRMSELGNNLPRMCQFWLVFVCTTCLINLGLGSNMVWPTCLS